MDSNIEARRKNFETWLLHLDKELYHTDYLIEGNSNFALPLILLKNALSVFVDFLDKFILYGILFNLF